MNKTAKFFSSLFLFTTLFSTLNAQQEDTRLKEYLKSHNYELALEEAKKLLEKDTSNLHYNYLVGSCYLEIVGDKSQSIAHFERVVAEKKYPEDAYYKLGLAYRYGYHFDKAIKAFEQYKEGRGAKKSADVERQIAICKKGKELVDNPITGRFENLGEGINTIYADYTPFVPEDESFIAFTSRRKHAQALLEFDGRYSSDIFIAPRKNESGQFGDEKLARFNTPRDEEVTGLSADGKELFYYIDYINTFGNIYVSNNNGKNQFSKKNDPGVAINSSYVETSANIAPDKNTLFFSSERPGGYGKRDLYITKKLPNGKWALPQNMGGVINSEYNEEYPVLSMDGKSLYFSSEGHETMGGYDLFVSTYDAETNSWSKPKNLGYPINSTANDMSICFEKDNKWAYTSTWRKEGIGNLDIYKVYFKENIVQVELKINDASITSDKKPLIVVSNIQEGKLAGEYRPNPNTGRFTLALIPGEYMIDVEFEGNLISKKIVISEPEDLEVAQQVVLDLN